LNLLPPGPKSIESTLVAELNGIIYLFNSGSTDTITFKAGGDTFKA